METQEIIDSGILELYVFGTLSEAETADIAKKAAENKVIMSEIIAIEKAIISLSYSMSPFLSSENYEKIRNVLISKHEGVVQLKPKNNITSYLGWAAAILLMFGMGTLFVKNQDATKNNELAIVEKNKLRKDIVALNIKNNTTLNALSIVRDENNTLISLAGQAVAPESKAKIYWNKISQTVFVDASGLPEPPEGMVYQIWSLQLNPLTPTSIGLLVDFKTNSEKIFSVEKTNNAQAFGITLEPEGGSLSPTMEQLYTLGKV